MSLKSTIENYKKAKGIYKEIDDKFYDLQQGTLEDSEFNLNQVLNRLNDFKKVLKYIQPEDLNGKYPEKTVEAVKTNSETFNEALYYWQRFFLGSKYALNLKEPIIFKYLPGLNLEPHELEKWGKTTKDVAAKLIAALTHPDNILEYEKSIRRMILGTMIQKEFNRIFELIKHKMIQSPKKFVSIDQYKKEK
jgi:hypothetical protein